jgi:hypothetical protein
MTSAKIDLLIILQFILYHGLWAVIAYGVPRARSKLIYWSAGVILVAQLILIPIGISSLLTFFLNILILTVVGIGVDIIFTRYQWWRFPGEYKTIPMWLCLLWLSFALSLEYLVCFVHMSLYFWALLSAVGFPLAYFFAQKLRVIQVLRPWPVYLYQGLIWLFLLPALLFLF